MATQLVSTIVSVSGKAALASTVSEIRQIFDTYPGETRGDMGETWGRFGNSEKGLFFLLFPENLNELFSEIEINSKFEK